MTNQKCQAIQRRNCVSVPFGITLNDLHSFYHIRECANTPFFFAFTCCFLGVPFCRIVAKLPLLQGTPSGYKVLPSGITFQQDNTITKTIVTTFKIFTIVWINGKCSMDTRVLRVGFQPKQGLIQWHKSRLLGFAVQGLEASAFFIYFLVSMWSRYENIAFNGCKIDIRYLLLLCSRYGCHLWNNVLA